MKVLISDSFSSVTKGRYIYLDNDFLSELFYGEDVFIEIIKVLQNNPLLIDPLTKFEFLRSVFLPEQLNLKKAFVEKEIFVTPTEHQYIFAKLQDNALLLSKIYAHQDSGKGTKKYGFVDLFLAARVMYQHTTCLLITGNKKDFPSCVFDNLGVINIEQTDGTVKPYCILRFNDNKFGNCLEALGQIKARKSEGK